MTTLQKDNYTLMLGDCLEMMKSIEDASVDLVLADMPYGTTQCRWDIVIPLEPLWEQLWRVAKSNAPLVLFCGQPFTSVLVASQLKEFKYSWVWEKNLPTGHLNARKMPMRKHEDICVFYKESPIYNPQGLKPFNKITRRGGNGENFGKSGTENFQKFTNYPVDVLRFSKDSGRLHPTQKPVALLEYLIRTYTNAGMTVLDHTMGSGSTGAACLASGRVFIGIEKEAKYFDIATSRLDSLSDTTSEPKLVQSRDALREVRSTKKGDC